VYCSIVRKALSVHFVNVGRLGKGCLSLLKV